MGKKLEDIALRSEEVQEILTKVPHWMIRWGNMLFLFLILLLLFMAWFIKYPDIIVSEVVVTTEIAPQQAYAQATGRLTALLVSNNDTVQKDQPLAIIENTANYEDVFKLKTLLDTIQISKKGVYFPIDSIPILFLGDLETPYALFENSYLQYQLNKDLKPFSNEFRANSYSISQLQQRLHNLQAQKNINQTELDLKLKYLQRHRDLFEKGVISSQDYESKQLEYAQAERNFKNFESSISQIKEAISNAYKTSKGSEITKVREEMVLLKNVIQSYDQLQNAIKTWEQQYVLKSNMKGKVTFLNYWNTNQTVNQGDLVFTIIPSENSSFVAKLKTPVQNSGKLKKGQKVNIKLENYPEPEFGVLNGQIHNISLVTNSEGLYLVDVALSDSLITSYNKEITFKQNMRGQAEIITEDLRLIDRFFYQFKSAVKY